MDRDKVIKGMEQFRSDIKPFCGGKADWERFDAGLVLLKEQENHDKELSVRHYVGEYYGAVCICPSCDATWIMGDDDKLHFCPQCGQKVKFEHH